jgi:hypothetical protein
LISSNFIVFPFRAVSGLFFSSLERQREKSSRDGAKSRTEAGGGCQGVSESAVSDKPFLLYGLARNRRIPKRPSEPRPMRRSPEEDGVEQKTPGELHIKRRFGAAPGCVEEIELFHSWSTCIEVYVLSPCEAQFD